VTHTLPALHAPPLAGSAAERTLAHGVAEARRRQKKIARIEPALAQRAAAVADAIEHGAARLAPRPASLIHGDFHIGQVGVHEGRIVLFDFDEFTLGDPMEDLAECAAKLETASPLLAHSLIDGYAHHAPQRFDHQRLQWHLTVQHLQDASRAFAFQRPGWAAELESRLACAEAHAAILAGGASA
jgi:aminoglycoside phosphotransferase (APT) family kinase protein